MAKLGLGRSLISPISLPYANTSWQKALKQFTFFRPLNLTTEPGHAQAKRPRQTHPLPKTLRNRAKTSGPEVFIIGTVESVKDRKHLDQITVSSHSAIVIASTGMLHAGAGPAYARAWLPHPENALFVVGYQDAESPGRRLLELQQGGDVLLPDGRGGREAVPAYSRIERFYLSAHADRGGLIGLIARYQPGKILLTHGEVRARTNMAGYLNTRHKVSLPVAGEVVSLQDSGRRRGAFRDRHEIRLRIR